MHAIIGRKSKTRSWAEAVTLKLYSARPFPELLFAFSPLIKSDIPEKASEQVATE